MRRWIALLLTVGLLLTASGCSFVNLDMETQLRSPKAVGEQSEIQTALEQHIFAKNTQLENGMAEAYVLKYPKMGEYRSAFVMKDIDGDGTEDALAFYALQPEGANSHIALLKKIDGVWMCVEDIEGLATEIERIHFGDLNGDGRPELFAGFSMYNTRDRRLMLYTWSEDHLIERYSDTYTHMIVGGVLQEDHDDLMLFRINSASEKTTVRLLAMEEDAIVEKGTAALDGHILQFGDYTFSTFSEEARGVYQDCVKDSQTTITELIVWDGTQLTAPLYDPAENITTSSARESGLPHMDIDNDGVIEWPYSLRMAGDELTPTEKMTLWMTEWYTWDQEQMAAVKKLTNIVNTADDYYLTVPEEWIGSITASYDATTRCLVVKEVVDGAVGEELLHIVAIPSAADNPLGNEEYSFLKQSGDLRYEVKYSKSSELSPSLETLYNMFVICEID